MRSTGYSKMQSAKAVAECGKAGGLSGFCPDSVAQCNALPPSSRRAINPRLSLFAGSIGAAALSNDWFPVPSKLPGRSLLSPLCG
jgi:hypothetical protein